MSTLSGDTSIRDQLRDNALMGRPRYAVMLEHTPRGDPPVPVAVDFDVRQQIFYFIEFNSKKIYSVSPGSGDVSEVSIEGVSAPGDLAVDWVHGNLYVIDKDQDSISVSRLHGNQSKMLVWGGMDKPRSIAVDPHHGWMYWTDWGDNAKIEKCGMNGRQRQAIVTENIVWPNGITIDYVDQRLYWVDIKLNQISSTNLDGGDFRPLLRNPFTPLGHPFAISVYKDMVYWSDWADFSVFKMNKYGRGKASFVDYDLRVPFDVKVYHLDRQPIKQNHCGSNNGGCSHLCLPFPQNTTGDDVTKKYECACPTGMLLLDTSACVTVREYFDKKMGIKL